MSQVFLTSIDLAKNQLMNAVLHILSSAPSSPAEAQMYYNSTDNIPYFHDDTTRRAVADRAWVVTKRLDEFAAPTSSVSMNSQKITSLATPTSANDAVTKAYVDGLVNGTDWKDSVRVATTANITLSGTQTIDWVSVVADERVLVKDQTDAEDNGLYLCKSGAWTRTVDADGAGEVTAGMSVFVSEGTANGNTQWKLTTNDTITIGTTELVFAQIGASTTYTEGDGIDITANVVSIDTTVTARHYHDTITGNDATTSFAITHSFWTRDVMVQVYQVSSPYATVYTDVERNSTSQVTVKFDVAPASGTDYRVVVVG
jgi:hypothetical protein